MTEKLALQVYQAITNSLGVSHSSNGCLIGEFGSQRLLSCSFAIQGSPNEVLCGELIGFVSTAMFRCAFELSKYNLQFCRCVEDDLDLASLGLANEYVDISAKREWTQVFGGEQAWVLLLFDSEIRFGGKVSLPVKSELRRVVSSKRLNETVGGMTNSKWLVKHGYRQFV